MLSRLARRSRIGFGRRIVRLHGPLYCGRFPHGTEVIVYAPWIEQGAPCTFSIASRLTELFGTSR